MQGAIAQLVEQRTENPCVPGSIPGGTTPPFIMPLTSLRRVSGFLFIPYLIKQEKIDIASWEADNFLPIPYLIVHKKAAPAQ